MSKYIEKQLFYFYLIIIRHNITITKCAYYKRQHGLFMKPYHPVLKALSQFH